MIDFVSEENLKLAKNFTDNVDCIMAAGNHEFSPTVFNDPAEPPKLREYFLDRVQSSFKNDMVLHGILWDRIASFAQAPYLSLPCVRGGGRRKALGGVVTSDAI